MYLIFKRSADFMVAFFGIVILLPLLLMLSIAVKLDSKGPVLFKQKRVGIHKTYFNMYKFRTMKIANDGGKWDTSMVPLVESRMARSIQFSSSRTLPGHL